MSFHEQSYQAHNRHLHSTRASRGAESITREDYDSYSKTADGWRHQPKFEGARAFLSHPEWRWVTVGDGSYGWDSVRLRDLGMRHVLPTDISPALLDLSKAGGLIDEYRVENAERLSFADASFDVVYCKESLHHCPRPFLALYEMLRVARQAVILVEPRDWVIDRGDRRTTGPVGLLRMFVSWLHGRLGIKADAVPPQRRFLLGDMPAWEDVGNYLYMISSRELEKLALGCNLPAIALKGLNDCLVSAAAEGPAQTEDNLLQQMQSNIRKADQLSASGFGSSGMLMCILFVTCPDAAATTYLKSNDWLMHLLPRNPHLK